MSKIPLWQWEGHGLSLLFEPRDLWVGLFWDTAWEGPKQNLYLYICLVPTLVVRWSVTIGRVD